GPGELHRYERGSGARDRPRAFPSTTASRRRGRRPAAHRAGPRAGRPLMSAHARRASVEQCSVDVPRGPARNGCEVAFACGLLRSVWMIRLDYFAGRSLSVLYRSRSSLYLPTQLCDMMAAGFRGGDAAAPLKGIDDDDRVIGQGGFRGGDAAAPL